MCVPYNEAMKRWLQTLVLVLAIFSLLAPVPALCAALQHVDHACCGADAQLAAPACCPDASPKPLMAQTGVDQVVGLFTLRVMSGHLRVSGSQGLVHHPDQAAYPPILLPATVLRT
jgi:hypothetical protein